MRPEELHDHDEEDDDLPVLNAVVESGNESIIQSSRLGREVLRELEVLQQSAPVKFVLQEHVLEGDEKEEGDKHSTSESQMALMMGDSQGINAASANSDDEIELMIDDIVDRHITELRKDIRQLLNRIKQNT